MKKWFRNTIAAALIISIGTGAAGCGKADKTQKEKPPMPEQEVATRGRYVETELTIPEKLSRETLIDFTAGENGRMEFMSISYRDDGNEEVIHTIYDGTEWRQEDSRWINTLSDQEGMRLLIVCCGQDGKSYAGFTDSNNQFHLYRNTEDGGYQEILQEAFKAPGQAGVGEHGLPPSGIEVNRDGDILLIDTETAYLYRPDGTYVCSMEQDALYNQSQLGSQIFNSEEYITFLNSDIVRYDLRTEQLTETIRCEADAAEEGNGVLAADDDGGIYLAGRSGLSHINKGATAWEQLIDGNLTTMGLQNLYLTGWVQGSEDDFFGIFMGEFAEGVRIFRYTYDAGMAAIPPVTLTVYSLRDVASVHQAASLMQKKNPDVRVDYRVAAKDGDETLQEDMIRSLNMELLNGKGADVLLLDGLPADTYQEKGILTDMRELFADINGNTPLLPFVLEDFTESDGAVYRMPVRLSFLAALGEPDALKALETLEGMKDYQGALPLLPKNNYENIMRLVATIRYEELYGDGKEIPGEEVLVRYLEAVKAIGGKNGAKTEFTKAELEGLPGGRGIGNEASLRGTEETPVGYDAEEAAATVMEFHSVYSSVLSWGVAVKRPGREPQPLSGIYFPLSEVGINQASAQKNVAEEFVRLLYSEEVQKIEFYQNDNEGFPVQMKALLSWKDLERAVNIGTGASDGYFLMGKWPGKERREQLVAMVSSLHRPVTADQTIMQMMADGAKGYLNGQETAEEAAAKIYRQISLYHAE